MIAQLIGAGIGALGSLVGGITSRNQAQEAERALKEDQQTITEWYNSKFQQDYLDSDIAKSTLAYLSRENQKANEKLQNSLIAEGSTAAQRVASGAEFNENYSEALTSLAIEGAKAKEELEQNYLNDMKAMANAKYQQQMGKAAASTSLIDLGGNLGSSIASL